MKTGKKPLSFERFRRHFHSDEPCRLHLFRIRWPNGFACPACGHGQYYEVSSRTVFHCRRCQHQSTLTAGTLMHKTRTPLHYWFWAIYLAAKGEDGLNALRLSKRLGLNMTTGASNMSFGLPNRHLINNGFLTVAIWCGVNAPIANPGAKGLVEAIMTADLIMGKDEYATRYIKHYRKSLKHL